LSTDRKVPDDAPSFPVVSVVIPARNEEAIISRVVRSVLGQCPAGSALEVIVVDDGSSDGTAQEARRAGARVVETGNGGRGGSPAAARNLGASLAAGNPLIFLDADCVPGDGWLESILAAHAGGETVVGGSLELPPGLPATARCDYYCGWYLVHPGRRAGVVPHHPPPNLSVTRDAFRGTSGFTERPPMEYTNEERGWLGELQRSGYRIFFEPRAVAFHHNRPGFGNLLRRNYRWGYTAIESKSRTGAARWAWMYRHPRLLILASPLLALAHTAYILACWARAGRIEPLLMLPAVLGSRFAYTFGMAAGGVQWIRRRGDAEAGTRPGPRWV
jgi:cellulose synthase/poly-beta-1,6-N-acetylglucosamine synthase-like glycosyltransferase